MWSIFQSPQIKPGQKTKASLGKMSSNLRPSKSEIIILGASGIHRTLGSELHQYVLLSISWWDGSRFLEGTFRQSTRQFSVLKVEWSDFSCSGLSYMGVCRSQNLVFGFDCLSLELLFIVRVSSFLWMCRKQFQEPFFPALPWTSFARRRRNHHQIRDLHPIFLMVLLHTHFVEL